MKDDGQGDARLPPLVRVTLPDDVGDRVRLCRTSCLVCCPTGPNVLIDGADHVRTGTSSDQADALSRSLDVAASAPR